MLPADVLIVRQLTVRLSKLRTTFGTGLPATEDGLASNGLNGGIGSASSVRLGAFGGGFLFTVSGILLLF